MARPNEPVMPEPLAYFLTWPTYGTWLPGDERGWVKHGEGFQLPDPVRELEAAARMTEDACRLDDQQRRLVSETIAQHCLIRHWILYAVNCRSNHVHVVVAADCNPESVRSQLKAWCTRRLKELDEQRDSESVVRKQWWAERGSRRYINNEEGLEAAIQYVCDGQTRAH